MMFWRHFVPTLFFAAVLNTPASAAKKPQIDIPYEKFMLDNGLTVIVHEDRKAPIVAVGVWYHVGSKDEKTGKTGFAHLFEHIMFEGSEHYNDRFSKPLEEVGATSLNGTTWLDRTNYFENVPTPALELALWLESDRMGHLLGVVTQEKLDQERGVVQNEKRQGDNQPYGTVYYRILEGLFPPGHPYRHSTIGSMEDLDAASLDDVHQWFRDYYGAANTVLVLAGDIGPERGRELAVKYFGDILAGPPVKRLKAWVPELAGDVEEIMYDRVPQTRSYHSWAVPGWTRRDRSLLELAASVLGDGKNSRLYQALIYEQPLAVNVSVSLSPFELASLFSIDATLAPDTPLQTVQDIIEQELQAFLSKGPSEEELARARSKINASTLRGLERVGGFSGKATTLAQGELYDGNPDFYQTELSWIDNASVEDVLDAARRWLSRGRHRLDVLPFGEHQPVPSDLDRTSGPPAVAGLPDLSFPALQRATLHNGLEVVLAERPAVPVVGFSMQFDAGYAADQGVDQGANQGAGLGTAGFTLAMMDESTRSRSALEIDALAESLGAVLSTDSDLDTSRVGLSALKSQLAASIDLYADVIRNPAFAADEMERLRGRWLANIEREKSQPVTLALRTLPPLLYGPDHAYGMPFTGSGTEASIKALTREDLARFHKAWIRPDNATLFVVGDATLEDVLPLLEKAFGSWRPPRTQRPVKTIAPVAPPEGSRLIVLDRPGSPQSLILAAHLAPPTGVANNIEIEMMNDIIGGTYSARVNQNLRVDKHWSYGAFTFLQDARGQRPWVVYAPVQTDRTADSIRELRAEIEAFLGPRPPTPEELNRVFRASAYSLPGRYETAAAVLGALQANARFDRPDDYVATLKDRYQGVTLEDVQQAARQVLRPQAITWVVVGDRALIEEELAELHIAPIEYIDTAGLPLPE
ncbi:MAG: pitrilysin family protein [Xanthomonadales bacterium]|nr:pitrilysin family protein [Xanthomonadales bacterium]